jgi:CRISPR-associated endonuclease/helicase Cas3
VGERSVPDRAFPDFFAEAFGEAAPAIRPYPYQERLATESWPDLLDVPTGLGKTAAVSLAWLYKRRVLRDPATPRRLVWCLPMRVLVEQTHRNIREWLERLGMLGEPGDGKVSVHLLMGGEEDVRAAGWVAHPEEDMVLVGTQDMLLSRALLRGYGMSRYAWPMHFGLLHNDALWVFDEVQLMGPGVATSAQLDAFRRRLGTSRAARSLWASATLNREWLATVDLAECLNNFRSLGLAETELSDPAVTRRREAVKRLNRAELVLDSDNAKSRARDYVAALANAVLGSHRPDATTLVVLNTVERAQALCEALERRDHTAAPLLVHARFRAAERRRLNQALAEKTPEAGRIVVATQAVEAGVDMTSAVLFTELAPWSSLVQRFGRCNRYGEWGDSGAEVYWIDLEDGQAAPYEANTLAGARAKLAGLASACPGDLPATDEAAPLVEVIRQRDFLALFDTDPDLTGFDVDVSRYIRDTDDRDVMLFWRDLSSEVEDQPRPAAQELCRAPIGQARVLLQRVRKEQKAVYVWDFLLRQWTPFRGEIRPGLQVMLDVTAGGYDRALGFDAACKRTVPAVPAAEGALPEADEDEPLSTIGRAVGLAEHLCDAEDAARDLCEGVASPAQECTVVCRAARWHDVGKAHPAFQHMLCRAMRDPGHCADAVLWAKSDDRTAGRPEYAVPGGEVPQKRPHFRHELASLLAWLGQHGDDADADLIAYLVAAHHGKLRLRLRAMPEEAEPPDDRLYARGIWSGDVLPGFSISEREAVGETVLRLDLMQLGRGPQGPSWTARTEGLLGRHGPFRLAWLETLVRLADWRATRKEQEDH